MLQRLTAPVAKENPKKRNKSGLSCTQKQEVKVPVVDINHRFGELMRITQKILVSQTNIDS